MVVLGFARLYPTYANISLSEVVSVKQGLVVGGAIEANRNSADRPPGA